MVGLTLGQKTAWSYHYPAGPITTYLLIHSENVMKALRNEPDSA